MSQPREVRTVFNTLPSNNPAATARPTPTSIPIQDGGFGGRQVDITFFDDDTAIKQRYWGPRFVWDTFSTSPITSTWVDWLVLDAPGVLEFLAAWRVSGTDTDDVELRIVLDGVQALHMTNFKESSGTAAGFVIVGDAMVDGITAVTGGGGISFDSIPFRSECRVQLRAESADDTGSVYKCMYRAHGTN